MFIRTSAGKVYEVLEAVKRIEGVKEAYAITGDYDIIAKVELEKIEDLVDKVAKKIHNIEGVTRTSTSIAIV